MSSSAADGSWTCDKVPPGGVQCGEKNEHYRVMCKKCFKARIAPGEISQETKEKAYDTFVAVQASTTTSGSSQSDVPVPPDTRIYTSTFPLDPSDMSTSLLTRGHDEPADIIARYDQSVLLAQQLAADAAAAAAAASEENTTAGDGEGQGSPH